MSRTLFVLNALILAVLTACATSGPGQCTNQITMLPLSPAKAARTARSFVRFRYKLSASDRLVIRSHEDTETSIGPYDLGFFITRDWTTLNRVNLEGFSQFRGEDADYWQSFSTRAITRACTTEGPIYFVTMKNMGDELSPALVFVIVPTAQGYISSALPMFSGGTVDVSRANPLHLQIWDNLNEGRCNACKTAYRVTEYEMRRGKLIRIREHRTERLYSSGQFGASRIRFVP